MSLSIENMTPAGRAMRMSMCTSINAGSSEAGLQGMHRQRYVKHKETPMTPTQARAVLQTLPTRSEMVRRRLLRHGELVLEAGELLLQALHMKVAGVVVDDDRVRCGCILHDCGKLLHPEELDAPGRRHEAAGQRMLLDHGVVEEVAVFCATHGDVTRATSLEEVLVMTADKLWKGKRVDVVEDALVAEVVETTRKEAWEVFAWVDEVATRIAADGDERLARSRV